MGQIVHNTSLPDDGLGDKLRQAFTDANTMNEELYATKVDKISGKDLSKNDYTDVDKAKVDALIGNEEANVQADWNDTDPSSDSYIKNKPVFLGFDLNVSAIWTETGLNFDVVANVFPVGDTLYAATPGVVTLDPADVSLDRIDLIVAIAPVSPATIGTVGKITGTPAGTALVVPPDYDPSLYYVIKAVTVRAAATVPEGVENTQVYGDTTTWTKTLTANLIENTSDPSEGVNCIEATNSNANDFASFIPPAPLSTGDLDLLEFDIKLKEIVIDKYFYITFSLAGVVIKNVKFFEPTGLFDGRNLDYQKISLNRATLNLPITNYDKIIIRPFWSSLGYYLDNVKIYKGSGAETLPQAGIEDAPDDGKLYGRQSLSWAEIISTLTAQERSLLFAGTSSGLLDGGVISINADPTKIDISAGIGVLVDRYTDPENPVLTVVTWTEKLAVPVTYLLTDTASHVFIDVNGDVYQQTTKGDGQDRREYIILDQLGHTNKTTVSTVINTPQLFSSPIDLIRDIISYLGVLSSGNKITPNGVNLSIDKAEGTLMSEGINHATNPFNPNIKSYAAQIPISLRRRTQTGLGTTSTFLDVGNYDVAGTITALATNKYTNQRVFMLTSGNIVVQYGQQIYNSLADAKAGINSEDFVLLSNLVDNAKLICIISVKSNATNLSDTAQAAFTELTGFGVSGGGEPSAVLSFNTRTGEIVLNSTDISTVINAATEKTTPIDADVLPITDSAAAGVLKKLSWINLKATLKTYFDSLYNFFHQTEITAASTILSTQKGLNKLYPFNSSTAQTITVNSGVYVADNVINIERRGQGDVEIIAGTGVRIRGVRDNDNRYFINDINSIVALLCRGSEEFAIIGNLTRGYTGAVTVLTYGSLLEGDINKPVTVFGTGFSSNMLVSVSANATQVSPFTYLSNTEITLHLTAVGVELDTIDITFDNGDLFVDTSAITILPADPIPAANLISYYKFNSSGTDDVSGYTAILGAGANYVTGLITNCLNVDNTATGFAYMVDNNDFSFPAIPFSISILFKIDTLVASTLVVKRSILITADAEYQINIVAGGELSFTLYDDGTTNKKAAQTTDAALTTGVWYLLTVTDDGTSNFSGISINVNGADKTLTDISGGSYVAMSNTPTDVKIGALWSTSETTTNSFDGQINMLAFWNKKLSLVEMVAIDAQIDSGNHLI